MELMVGGLVVSHSELMGACGGLLPMMEPTNPDLRQEQKKRLKSEVKRDKNRESSARSRQRKKDEDEHNRTEIDRLEIANEELRRKEELLLQEGRDLLSQVHPSYYDNPRCPGCPEEGVESEPRDVTPPPPHLSAPPPSDLMDH